MAKPRNKVLDYVGYLLARVGIMFVQALGPRLLYPVGRAVGNLLYVIDGRHRKLAIRQIRTSFPDWDDAHVRRVAREAMQSIVLLGLEMLITPQILKPERFLQHIRFKNLETVLEHLVRGDTGVILLTGHFGNWEVSGYTMAAFGFPAVAVARPLDNPYLNDFVLGVRERTGLKIVDKKGAAGTVDEVLDAKGVVCFIADQDAGRKGIFVDFFDREASTFRTIALMALRHNVPIAVGYTKRTDDGFHFELGVERVIHPADWADRDDEVRWITQTYTSALEAIIRRDPGQYFGWAHRRWKHRPDGTKER